MALPSSVIRQAQSSRKKQRTYEDSIASFEYDLSAKTVDDFNRYLSHIESRLSTESDQSQALSYQKTIYSAQRSFISHEIQREAISVLEGGQNLTGKYNTMYGLYQMAIDQNDLNTAQSLRQQLDSLDVQLQNEANRNAGLAEKMSKAQVSNIKELNNRMLNDETLPATSGIVSIAWMDKLLRTEGEAGFNAIAEATGGVGFWDAALTVMEDIEQNLIDAAEIAANAGDFDTYQSIVEDLTELQSGDTKVKIGGQSFSKVDIVRGANTARTGNDLFSVAQSTELGIDGTPQFKLQKNKVTDYVWARDRDGKYELVATRDLMSDDFNAPLLDEAGNERKDSDGNTLTTKQYLQNLGYDIIGESDGQLQIRQTLGTSNIQSIPGITPGQTFNVVIGEDGNPRFVASDPLSDQPRVFDIDLTSGELKEITGDNSVSIFGREGSAPSEAGIRFAQNISKNIQDFSTSRLSQQALISGSLDTTTGVISQGRANFLQGQELQRQLQDQIQAASNQAIQVDSTRLEQAGVQLGSPKLPSLNQTPLPAGNATLKVVDSKPKQTITGVSEPRTGTITNVGPAKPKQTITGVAAPKKQPTVVVR